MKTDLIKVFITTSITYLPSIGLSQNQQSEVIKKATKNETHR